MFTPTTYRPTRGRLAALLGALVFAAAVGAQGDDADVRLRLSATLNGTQAEPTPEPAGDGKSYRVDTGDRVSIDVYQEPDLNLSEVRVRDDGTISFPLIGDLAIRGMTSTEIKELVTRRLADGYLKRPNVSVSIDSYRLYYIKGEVARPGGYSYMDGLTVEKAIALAGGFTERASKRAISLVREKDPDDVVESTPPSTRVSPGDVITVGESFF